jgi:hypothetical protein
MTTTMPADLAEALEAERSPLVEARCARCKHRLVGRAGVLRGAAGELYWFAIESTSVPDPTPAQRRDRRLELAGAWGKLTKALPFGGHWRWCRLNDDGPDVAGWCARHGRRTFTRAKVVDAIRRRSSAILA